MKPVFILLGPTAVGKTDLAIRLALKFNADIISADSRQVYKYMDIGTSKPSKKQLELVKHHCIDKLEPHEYFSAGEFATYASKKIEKIFKRNKNVIVCGGSGFYIQALTDGLSDFDVKDLNIRKRLQNRLEKEGLEILYKELKKVDEEWALTIKQNDTQRILRGMEVYLSTGKKLSTFQKKKKKIYGFNFIQIGLNLPREQLIERINKRVDRMIESGLIDEVINLKNKKYDQNNALNSVGYKEKLEFLNKKKSFQESVENVKKNTRQYAKRQMTWFKRDERTIWFSPLEQQKIIDLIAQYFN